MSASRGSRTARWWRRAAQDEEGAGERTSLVLALAAGIATVFAFAPFGLHVVAFASLAVLFSLWQRAWPAEALRAGFAFGVGCFGAGVSWIYVALNTFGGMPASLAAIGTAGFCAYLALFPALAGWLATRWIRARSPMRLVASAGAWTLLEWIRSFLFTGFPWLGIGYVTLPDSGPTALAGYGPVGGVWLVGLACAGVAACLAAVIDAWTRARRRELAVAVLMAVALVGSGAALQRVTWTSPVGDPITISLVQGNVGQDVKFDPQLRAATFELYIGMARASRGRIVVLPESALPAFADEIPDKVVRDLLDVALARHGSVLTGVFTVEPPLPGTQHLRYYNSVIALGEGEVQLYRKRHLVPFGESIPLEPVVGWFIRSVLSIPLANQSAGAADQAAFRLAGQSVAVDICYEDVFGPDIRSQAPAATLLVNVTNDAWYGHSIAALQHNQIAAMRALETGRPMLRATNTGITSSIDHRGQQVARLPWFTRGTLETQVTGRAGLTPYVRWGDAPAVAIAVAVLVMGVLGALKAEREARLGAREVAQALSR